MAGMINTSSGSENPILRLVSDAKKEGCKVRVVSTYDFDAVVASGVFIKYLLQNDVRYEYLTVLELTRSALSEDVPTIAFDTHLRDLRRGVSLVRGERSEIRKVGNNYLLTTPHYSYTVLKALEDVMIVTNDVRYYVLASMLSKYVPRIKQQPMDDVVKGYVKELCDLNVLKVVSGLKIFNYSLTDLDKAISKTLDLFIPGYTGVRAGKDLKTLSSEELSKEILSKIAAFSEVKVSPNDLVGDNYFITQDWFFKDVYEFLYALMSVADLYGTQYIIASISTANYVPLIRLKYEELLGKITSNIYRCREVGPQQLRKNLYKVRLDSLTPITPVTKVLKSYLVPQNSAIVYEVGNDLYISLFDTTLESATSLVKGGYERVGNLIKFKELRTA